MITRILATAAAALLFSTSPLWACPGGKACGSKAEGGSCQHDKNSSDGGHNCPYSEGHGSDAHAVGHGKGKHNGPIGATATVSSKIEGDQFTVKVAPPQGAHLNYDGPWKLELSKEGPITSAKGGKTVGMDAFNKESGQFEFKLNKPLQAGEKLGYKVTYFLCADDKSWCKRLQYEEMAGN